MDSSFKIGEISTNFSRGNLTSNKWRKDVSIGRASYAVTTFLGPELIRLPTNEGGVQESTNRYLETHVFPQCIGAIDGTHKEIVEPSEHYSDLINRKAYFSLNVQAVVVMTLDYVSIFQSTKFSKKKYYPVKRY